MKQNSGGWPTATSARIVLAMMMCIVGLAQRSEANLAYYSDTWMSDYYDYYDDWEPIYGMGVMEADYGEYDDVYTQSYLYGPDDEYEGCFDEDEYYAEADTALGDSTDDEATYEVDSDAYGEDEFGQEYIGSSSDSGGVGRYLSHYDYGGWAGGSTYRYDLAGDSSGKQCSHAGYTWGELHMDGLTDSGFYAIVEDFGGCTGKCTSGQSGSVAGPSGTPSGSRPAC